MMRRSLRIWPLYFLLIAIAPLIISWLDFNSPNYLTTILFINNFETIKTTWWVYPFAHFWSICIEEHFYLAWPFVIAFIPKKWLLNTFVLLILGSIIFRIYSFYSYDHVWYTLYLHTLSRLDVIVLGAIGAYFYSEKPFEFKLHRLVRIALFVILIISLSLEPVSFWDTAFLAGFKKYIYLIIISLLLLDFNFGFKHILPKKSFIHYLGKISYGIYMYSDILNTIIIEKIMKTYQITNLYVFFLLMFSLSIIIPIISYELIEKHILKLNKYFRVIETDR
jgi:peptidoglycan/LPS O-acetylase OafA/YrhL